MTENLPLSSQIEALLFYKGESVTLVFLSTTLGCTLDEVKQGVSDLEERLNKTASGMMLITRGDEVMLATNPIMGKIIEALVKEEISRDLGKAGLETLAIVLYRGPIARSEINYLRGVNSNYILRNLLVRGLIEKQEGSSNRSIIYQPTFELLSYLGISNVKELPEYDVVEHSVEEFKEEQIKDESVEENHEPRTNDN